MEEKTILCIQCGNPFTLTVDQQERLIAVGFAEPKRCRECRNWKVKSGLSRYEEKMRRENRDLKRERESAYNIQKKRDALIVVGNGFKSSIMEPRPISMMEDDGNQ